MEKNRAGITPVQSARLLPACLRWGDSLGIQLLLAARSFFACRRNSRKLSLLYQAPAIPAIEFGSDDRIRLLSILASQAVQMPAEFA
jgi:hypothetical protein